MAKTQMQKSEARIPKSHQHVWVKKVSRKRKISRKKINGKSNQWRKYETETKILDKFLF